MNREELVKEIAKPTHSVNIAFKFIDVEENMNLRFREGVFL